MINKVFKHIDDLFDLGKTLAKNDPHNKGAESYSFNNSEYCLLEDCELCEEDRMIWKYKKPNHNGNVYYFLFRTNNKYHSGVTEEEEAHRLAADFHSEHDLGLLMLSSFLNPHFDSISMKIVAGKDLGVMICRTKQTPAKEKLTKSLKPSSFANVVNDALRIGREVEAGKFYPGKIYGKVSEHKWFL